MSIAPRIAALAAMTDDELIAAHDQHARQTEIGQGFYRDELNRRAQDRTTAAALAEAKAARTLAIWNMVVAVAAVAIAVAAIVVQIALA